MAEISCVEATCHQQDLNALITAIGAEGVFLLGPSSSMLQGRVSKGAEVKIVLLSRDTHTSCGDRAVMPEHNRTTPTITLLHSGSKLI